MVPHLQSVSKNLVDEAFLPAKVQFLTSREGRHPFGSRGELAGD